jgi:hypothetical protein
MSKYASLTRLAIKARTATRQYLAALGSALSVADDDERDDIRTAIEKAGRDWASDHRIAEWAWEIHTESGECCDAMWSLGFLNALRALANAIGKTESETFRLGIAEFGQSLTTKDLKAWMPETEEEATGKRDVIADAIATLQKNITDERVVAFLKANG